MKLPATILLMTAASLAFGAGGNAYSNRSGIFSFHQYHADYIQFLSESVYWGYKDIAPVSYAEMPAFGPERGFWLCPDKDAYFVVWSEATTNLWYWAGFTAPEEDKPRCMGRSRKELLELAAKEGAVKFYEARIPSELGARVARCWQMAVLEAGKRGQVLPFTLGRAKGVRFYLSP